MLSQELRIGNLVGFYKSKIHEIQYGKIYEIAIPENPQALEDIYHVTIPAFGSTPIQVAALQPIPLTIDWLLRLSFKEQYKGQQFTIPIRYVNLEIRLAADGEHACAIGSEAVVLIRYVHQLQNLFFALTTQELQIKEA